MLERAIGLLKVALTRRELDKRVARKVYEFIALAPFSERTKHGHVSGTDEFAVA